MAMQKMSWVTHSRNQSFLRPFKCLARLHHITCIFSSFWHFRFGYELKNQYSLYNDARSVFKHFVRFFCVWKAAVRKVLGFCASGLHCTTHFIRVPCFCPNMIFVFCIQSQVLGIRYFLKSCVSYNHHINMDLSFEFNLKYKVLGIFWSHALHIIVILIWFCL